MTRGKGSYGRFVLAALVVGGAASWVACDGDETTFNRVSETGGGTDSGADGTANGDAASDGGGNGDGAADASDGAVPSTGPVTFATGSGETQNPTLGYGDHTCVVAGAERAVYCWGANDNGQIGIGTTGAGTTAADVATATKIATDETGLLFAGIDEISAAGWHTCARRQELLFCWGQRFTGAQAEPPADVAVDRTKPRAIGNLAVKAIAAGGAHTCVLKTNGKYTCFGHSYFNELGRARLTDPVCTAPFFYPYAGVADHTCSGELLESMANVMSAKNVVAGEIHSCSLADGHAYCWGNNTYAQLGVAGTQVGELNAQEVIADAVNDTPLDQVSVIASGGGNHTCALRAGKVHCWGANGVGQLGADPGALVQRPYAVEVPGIADATAIGAAEGISCAVRAGGTVWCWGSADNGQIGDAGAAFDGGLVSFTPVQIKGAGGVGNLTDVVAVAPGRRHVCARKVDNSVWCWGKNDRGQLGDGSTTDSTYPVKVTGLP